MKTSNMVNRFLGCLKAGFLCLFLTSYAVGQTGTNTGIIPENFLRLVSIDMKNASLKEALAVIIEKGELDLDYNESIISLEQKITVAMDSVPVFKILMRLLNGIGIGLAFTRNGHGVLLPPERSNGKIMGTVIDRHTREPLIGANVTMKGSDMGAAAAKEGKFIILHIPAGIYSIEASMVGYERKQVENIIVTESDTIELLFELAEEALSLGEIIVMPGYFSLMENMPATPYALKAEDIRSFPQLGEDIYRAVTRLPGVGGNDISAKFTIRGGEHNEVLVLLDGMKLYDPFHLEDLDGFLSIVDVEAIRNIDMMTGAFPVEYGDCLSGVFNMKIVVPSAGEPKTSLAISFLNTRLRSQGSLGNGDWRWLFVARRGYLDLLLKVLNPEDKVMPVYYDVFGKIQYTPNPRHSFSAHVLASRDDVVLVETNDEVQFDTGYGNSYGWLTWSAQFHPKLFTQTLVSKGRVDRKGLVREIPGNEDEFHGEASIERYFNFYGLKQDWSLELFDRSMLKWGFDFKQLSAGYDFFYNERKIIGHINGNEIITFDTTQTQINPDGNEFGAYLGNRVRPFDPLTAEIGIRYDYASWTDDKNVSPRINIAYDFGKHTVIRMGWGKFHQTQGIHRLNAGDGDELFYPAELAEHFIIGMEHAFWSGFNLRIEGYQKRLSSLRPRYYNFRGFTLNPFAEIHPDRIRIEPERGESKGIEIYLKQDMFGKFRWWASYGYAVAEDRINGAVVPRNFDQRHTIYLDVSYQANSKWRLNAAWQYHSGWPFTESTVTIIKQWPDGYYNYEWAPGPLNAGRLPAYHRMDIRASRFFQTSRGRISAFFEIRNIYNRRNIREYKYRFLNFPDGDYIVRRDGTERFLPVLPSFGVIWEF